MPARLTDPATVFAWAGARWRDTPAAAAFALDRVLGDVVRTTTQPLLGQMRLTWWHEALEALDRGERRAHPVIVALAEAKLNGAALARMVDGWEVLLGADPIDAAALDHFAAARGEPLFTAAAGSRDDMLALAGRGWALADLATNTADPALAGLARERASAVLEQALASRWPTRLRSLGALAHDARAALAKIGDAGSPRRAAMVLAFRLRGR